MSVSSPQLVGRRGVLVVEVAVTLVCVADDVVIVVSDVNVLVLVCVVDVRRVALMYSSTAVSLAARYESHVPHMFGHAISTARSAQLKPAQKGKSVTPSAHTSD